MNGVENLIGKLTTNYQSLPSSPEFGEGRLWKHVTMGNTSYEQYYTGDLFRRERPLVALLKVIALLACKKILFLGGTACNLAKIGRELTGYKEEVSLHFKFSGKQFISFVNRQPMGTWTRPFRNVFEGLRPTIFWFSISLIPFPLSISVPFVPIPDATGLLIGKKFNFLAGYALLFYFIYDPRCLKPLLNTMEKWMFLSPEKEWGDEGKKAVDIKKKALKLLTLKTPLSKFLGWEPVKFS